MPNWQSIWTYLKNASLPLVAIVFVVGGLIYAIDSVGFSKDSAGVSMALSGINILLLGLLGIGVLGSVEIQRELMIAEQA